MKKHYYIYRIDTDDNKFYVGKRQSTVPPEQDTKYLGSGVKIKTYADNLKSKTILAIAKDENQLKHLESIYIKEAKLHKNCLNIQNGTTKDYKPNTVYKEKVVYKDRVVEKPVYIEKPIRKSNVVKRTSLSRGLNALLKEDYKERGLNALLKENYTRTDRPSNREEIELLKDVIKSHREEIEVLRNTNLTLMDKIIMKMA